MIASQQGLCCEVVPFDGESGAWRGWPPHHFIKGTISQYTIGGMILGATMNILSPVVHLASTDKLPRSVFMLGISKWGFSSSPKPSVFIVFF